MSDVTEDNRAIARAAAAEFGGKPSVTRFWDDQDSSAVDILECPDSPTEGVTSCSTLGLSDHPLVRDGNEYPVRVEVVGAGATDNEHFPNIISTIAFFIINDQWFCSPGSIFPDVVGMYYPAATMRHILFVPPFLWADELETMHFPGKTVAWLQAVPISEGERQYATANGSDALQDLFVQNQIDVFNLDRDSTVAE
ncbi:MAG: suppressor of fused domain protein [Saccharopolyspora sp.]|uniref:suppressor of fused domain protein n=1 Tax=Saccharopolyspora TaxID=1835 RepID=UPI00190A2D02|nr:MULTISPECIES: suppressor of fused domain protein [unclassified Saccharopolyspora]MBK0869563.1 suppressor of fused domain protein [Saccharopolyspora sp. HNM0986]MBQ6640844.1 suppressor of fused domain protein [Saccharopolyspora sp.]